MVARILGRRRGEDRAPLVDGQRLGPRRADVDSQRDAHGLISQRSPHRRTRGVTPSGSRRASASKTCDRDRIEGEHVVVMRHDEPRPDRGGQVDGLGRRHVARHAPRRVPAVDRQEQHVERLGPSRIGQAVVGQTVATMIPSDSLGLDDVPPRAGRPPERGPGHPDARPVRPLVLAAWVLGQVRVDDERPRPRFDQETALSEPPDGQRGGRGSGLADLGQQRLAVSDGFDHFNDHLGSA